LFSNASVIAGYGGSGMLNMIYGSGGGRRLVICSAGYNAVNEYQIASVLGDKIDYFYCPTWPRAMDSGWQRSFFNSDFRFDFEHDGAALAAFLEN
jgi:capsular polysaccharide biosynthesis protein